MTVKVQTFYKLIIKMNAMRVPRHPSQSSNSVSMVVVTMLSLVEWRTRGFMVKMKDTICLYPANTADCQTQIRDVLAAAPYHNDLALG
jgi:hypothetical protein